MEPKALRAKVETRRKGWRDARCAGRRGRRGAGAAAVMDGPIRRRGGAAALIEQRAAPRNAHTRAAAGQPAARDEAPPITRKSASEPFRR